MKKRMLFLCLLGLFSLSSPHVMSGGPLQDAVTFLYEMHHQWHEKFWVFRSQDSGANVISHPAKDANGWTGYNVFHNDTNNEAVGLTCIRMDITHPPSEEWIGWHHLFPEGNWNGDDQGYDLRGTGPLSFKAKASQAGIGVQFRMRYKDQNGTTVTVYPVEADPSHRVTLAETYQTFHFEFADPQTLASVFELFAVIIESDYQNPASYAVYLDDMRYDLTWHHDDPHLLESMVPKDYGVDFAHLNQAQVYDQILVGLAFLRWGTPEARLRAWGIAQSLLFAMNHSPNPDVRLFNAYRSGMLYDRSTDIVAFPGFWNYDDGQWQIDANSVKADTGNMCWAILFFLEIHKQFPGTPIAQESLEAARWLGDFLLANLQAPQGEGFLLGMEPSVPADPTSPYNVPDLCVQSTEMNLDATVAFRRLHLVDGQAKWGQAALSAWNFVRSMVNEQMGILCTGTDGNCERSCSRIPEDVQSWTILATEGVIGESFPFYGRMVGYVESEMLFTPSFGCDYYGFDFSDFDEPDGVWFEGTAHMARAYKALGMNPKAQFFLSEIERALEEEGAHPEYPLWLGKGVPAACRDYLTTGFGGSYFNRPSVAPTAWYLMAAGNYNPLDVDWEPPTD